MTPRPPVAAIVALTVLLSSGIGAQVAEFEFYPAFRQWWFALPQEQRTSLDVVLEGYRQRLHEDGTATEEIVRRVELIKTRRPALEADFWNRFFTVEAPAFNTAPNEFLVSVAQGRKPGKALDVGMGEGRNSLYLAKLGWQVTGFDPADKAVALAQERARKLGLTIDTAVSHDRDFPFGSSQWDLIVFSYMPVNQPERVADALRPGGIVMFVGPQTWFPRNGLLKAFDSRLRILHYEDVMTTEGDFFQGQSIPLLRFVAERPLDNAR